jgi:hypothetical protein
MPNSLNFNKPRKPRRMGHPSISCSEPNFAACGIRPLRGSMIRNATLQSLPRPFIPMSPDTGNTTEPGLQVAPWSTTCDLLRGKQATSPNTMITGERFRPKSDFRYQKCDCGGAKWLGSFATDHPLAMTRAMLRRALLDQIGLLLSVLRRHRPNLVNLWRHTLAVDRFVQ